MKKKREVDAKDAINSVLAVMSVENNQQQGLPSAEGVKYQSPNDLVQTHLENLYSRLLDTSRDSTVLGNVGLPETQRALFQSSSDALNSVRAIAELCGIRLPDDSAVLVVGSSSAAGKMFSEESIQYAMSNATMGCSNDDLQVVEAAFTRMWDTLTAEHADSIEDQHDLFDPSIHVVSGELGGPQ